MPLQLLDVLLLTAAGWVASVVLSLAAGILRGRPLKALVFGLMFGPFALVVIVLDLLEHRRPS